MIDTKANSQNTSTLYAALDAIVGAQGLTCDADAMAPWLTDWRGRYHGKALAMVSPRSTDEVSQIVALAAVHGVPIVPQGGNSGMVAGATPSPDGDAILLSMRRMDAIRSIDTANRQIVVEAGMILENLHNLVADHGLRFPLTLGGKGSATIGGLISTNAGGTQVLQHGTMRALVEGLEAVLPDGAVYHGLAALKKDNRGYDLKHLLIGAEGTLGIVTAATLRLVPALVDRCVIWAGLESPHAARALLQFIAKKADHRIEGFEILPREALDHVLKHIPGTRAPLDGRHRWHALIEIVSDDPDGPAPGEIAEAIMAEALGKGLAENAVLSASEAQAEAFWKIRDSISEAERAQGPAMQHDISVPVADMPDFIESGCRTIELEFPGCRGLAFGHLGDGNVHFHVAAPAGADATRWYGHDGPMISARVYELVVEAKGSISAEHGIGQAKRHELARLDDPARLQALIAIKRALDPQGIMNPGKLIPLAPARQAT